MENELQRAKEQLKLSSHLSKELANAQREIRELRRENDIQHILRRKNSVPANLVSDTRIPLRENHVPTARATSVLNEMPVAMRQKENVFSPLPDKVMLRLFSFLDEDSMVAISVTDRVLIRRVNFMFGVTTPPSVASSARPASVKQSSLAPRRQSKLRFMGSSPKVKVLCHVLRLDARILAHIILVNVDLCIAFQGRCNREILKAGSSQALS